MRTACGLLLFAVLLAASAAQDATPPQIIRVRTLTLVSSSLSEPLRQDIIHGLHGIETDAAAEELAERVRQKLRDAGYYKSIVDDTRISSIRETPNGRFADVSFRVEPGALYTLGEIRFEGGHVFSADEMRRQFSSVRGEHFNATQISLGLDNLKYLYGTKGYANYGAIPKPIFDEAQHIIDLTIEIDEGRQVHFGRLILEGVEPRAGVGKSLLDGWNLQGKLYDPQLVKEWVAANTSSWPKDAAAQVNTEFSASGEDALVFNVLLHFQQSDP